MAVVQGGWQVNSSLIAAQLWLSARRRLLQCGAVCEYPQLAYSASLKATFIELPAFERLRQDYLSDEEFAILQQLLMVRPEAGDVMPGTGGLRKLRFADFRRGKGTRGGLRVIYFHWLAGRQFWLFTLYGKNEVNDLTFRQRQAFKKVLTAELDARRFDG